MNWQVTILAGAGGGLVVEAVAFLANLNEYRLARRQVRAASRRRAMPPWSRYFDPLPDALAAATRLLLGAGAGAAFHGQVTTVVAAVAVGAAAPALFGQFGAARSMRELNEATGAAAEQKNSQ
ncbi:hypothetical protein ACQP06_18775 [Nocardia sp. CA-136227]|uniref:hypothetical protein n=1 Tax=Nocardia sp. CA-136227 TaxID=3239979 RepID=UPI003D9574D5